MTSKGETAEVRAADPVPERMRASVLAKPGRIVLEERLTPSPGDGDVLVRVTAVGICGSDHHYFEHGRIGDFVVDAPLVLGHEAAGVVVGVGSGVPRDRVGERVSLEPQRPRPFSEAMKTGRYNLDPDIEFFATPPIDGALAEYVVLPAAFAHPVPDRVSDESAALMEPLSVAVAGARRASVQPGASVFIAGAGPIGVLLAQTCRAFGASTVVVSDIDEARLARVQSFGATETVTAQDAGALSARGFDVFFDATGAPSAIDQGLRALRPAGTAVLIGMGPQNAMLPVDVIRNRELMVTGLFRYANTWPVAIDLVTSGAVELDSLVTARYGLEDVSSALRGSADPESLKVIVQM